MNFSWDIFDFVMYVSRNAAFADFSTKNKKFFSLFFLTLFYIIHVVVIYVKSTKYQYEKIYIYIPIKIIQRKTEIYLNSLRPASLPVNR